MCAFGSTVNQPANIPLTLFVYIVYATLWFIGVKTWDSCVFTILELCSMFAVNAETFSRQKSLDQVASSELVLGLYLLKPYIINGVICPK